MKNKIFIAIIFLIAAATVSSDYWIPKFRPFGTSTTLTDSTNYMNLTGKGLNVPNDSMRVGRWLFVGTKSGGIYLDTNRQGVINFNGQDFLISNGKDNGGIEFYAGEKNSSFAWVKNSGGSSLPLMYLDTINGLQVQGEDISTSGTGQVKMPSDTASDYDANDAITLNRQNGILTTKSLTTAAVTSYSLTWTNSLISSTSRVFAIVQTTLSAGTPMIVRCSSGSGSSTISIYNAHASTALNNSLIINVMVIN